MSTMRRWFSGAILSMSGLVLAAVLMASANLWAGATVTGARLDLTRDALFTLSPGARNILRRIDEPITLRFYFSERLGREIPSYATYANRVRDMLREFAAVGGLRLEFLDPEPFSDIEDRAVGFGLQGLPIDETGEQVYFGLAGGNSTDDVAVIGFFQIERERFLEYDLINMVYNLANPKKPVIGVSTTLPIDGNMQALMAGRSDLGAPWTVMRQLRQRFEVRSLGEDPGAIDDDIDVLMLVHPTGLSPQSLYAIDQFLLNGGKALIFVDPHAEGLASRPLMGPPKPTASDLKPLFDAWGIELVAGKVAGDLRFARRVNAGTGQRIEPAPYLAWLGLDATALNGDDPVVGNFRLLNLASAGILRRADGASATMTPLFTTSAEAMPLDAAGVMGRPDIMAMLRAFQPTGERYVLAARLGGTVKTAYPDGPPKPAEDGDGDQDGGGDRPPGPAADQTLESVTPLNVILVADTDMLEDRFWVRVQDFFGQRLVLPLANNGDFVINAIDNLSGSGDLIGLRGRGTVNRPFERIERLRRAAEQRLRGKEQELRENMRQTEQKLARLQTTEAGGGAVILSAEQQLAIQEFRQQLLDIRRQLRAVRRDLRRDIEGLEGMMRFANIGLIPILVGCLALGLGLWRSRRHRRRAGMA